MMEARKNCFSSLSADEDVSGGSKIVKVSILVEVGPNLTDSSAAKARWQTGL